MQTHVLPTVRGLVVGVMLGAGLMLGGAGEARGSAASPGALRPAAADTSAPIVRDVAIQGRRHFSAQVLRQNIRTRPNRRILGIPGFTWWRWVYRLGRADWMWDRLGAALRAGGEPPAYLDSTTVRGDAERLKLFYRQRGFRDAAVRYTVEPTPVPDRVRVVFRVEPGAPTFLRRIRYAGLGMLQPSQQRRLLRESVFPHTATTLGDTLALSGMDQRYREPMLLEERRRILAFLQARGYAAASRDSVTAVVYPAGPDSLDVTLRVRPGPRYRFGAVRFVGTGPERTPPRYDTLAVPTDTTGGRRPQVTTRIEDDGSLDPAILRRSLQFAPGAIYDASAVQATKRRLENTGVFAFTSLSPQFDAASPADSAGVRFLPLRIEGRTRERHELQAETFALQRESIGATEAGLGLNEFGVGLSGVYENINALGGGETFQLRASASVATGLDSTLISSNQFEGSASLVLPYLIRPFQGLDRTFGLSDARTRLSLTALTALRSDLGLRIRSRVNARLRLEMDHTPTHSSLVDVLDLSVSNPDTLDQFSRKFLDRVFGPSGGDLQDPVQRQQILEDYTQPQVNTAVRYTFRDATANPLRRRNGHIYEASAEVGNTIPLLLDRLVYAPDSMNYALPSLFGGGLTGRLLYRPYVRASVDLRRYVPLGEGTTLGLKLFGGLAHPTGRPTVVPLDRRFFSGGANSVRGWRLRELGPGGAVPPVDTTADVQGAPANILGGDLKLETSMELRTTLLPRLLAARWGGAVFLDAGNMWFGPRNNGFGTTSDDPDTSSRSAATGGDGKFDGLDALLDVGVGGGLGLRLEWEYLIVRLDLAYRLHDPSPRNDDIFGDQFRGPLLHFGIGQAF